MTQSITPRNGAADISAAVPTQRIVTSEAVTDRVRDHRGRFTSPDALTAGTERSETRRRETSPAQSPARSTTGRSRSADRAERAARARAERAAARARAEADSELNAELTPESTSEADPQMRVARGATRATPRSENSRSDAALPNGSPDQSDPMEDRAKRFRAALSEMTTDRHGSADSGHGGPLVRARAARTGVSPEPSTLADRPARSRSTRSSAALDRPQRSERSPRSDRPQRLRSPERLQSSEHPAQTAEQRPSGPRAPRSEGRDNGSGATRAESRRAEALRTEALRTEAQRAEALRTEAQRAEAPRTEAQRAEALRAEAAREQPIRLRSPLADLRFDRLELTAALPDLTAALGAVPGGLGAETADSFVFAGQQWTSSDAHACGTPIGMQLAMEQRGLGVSAHPHPGASSLGAPGLDALETEHLPSRHLEGDPLGYGNSTGVGRRRASV